MLYWGCNLLDLGVAGVVHFVSNALLICDCSSCVMLNVCVNGVVCCVSALLELCFLDARVVLVMFC